MPADVDPALFVLDFHVKYTVEVVTLFIYLPQIV